MTRKIISILISLVCSMTAIICGQTLTDPTDARPPQTVIMKYVLRVELDDPIHERDNRHRIPPEHISCEICFSELSLTLGSPLREAVTEYQIRNEDGTDCIASYPDPRDMIKALSAMPPATYSIALAGEIYYLIGNINI